MSGFIALHRSLLEWEWYPDINVRVVFIHCLMLANYKEKKWKGIAINRGQFISSRKEMAKQIGITEQQFRTAINKLISTNDITSTGRSQHTVFTVVNYDKYQTANQPDNQQLTNEQPADNQQSTTTNKDNKDNKEINNTPKPKKSVSKTLLDGNLELSDHWKDLAIKYWSGKNRNDLDPGDQFFQFKKHHMANATKSADWQSSWETWYCNAVKFNKAPFQLIQGNQPQPSNSPRQSMPKAGTIE